MALGGKTSQPFYVTSGGGTDEINASRKVILDAAFSADKLKGNAQLIDDNTLGPLVFNIQRMQDDLDELRRYVADATEMRTIVSPLPVANGGTGLTASQPLLYTEVSITAGEMANMHNSRKTLVAAQGAGTMIVPVSAIIRATKLNVGTNNTVLSNMHIGYGDDRRDGIFFPIMHNKGLLYRMTESGTHLIAPVGNRIGDESVGDEDNCVNVELHFTVSADVGVNGASASKISLLYYIATVT
tara:strand:- start:327 stop:1052 length:726 start_codon:yes stop_codon:yes gene_type:complete